MPTESGLEKGVDLERSESTKENGNPKNSTAEHIVGDHPLIRWFVKVHLRILQLERFEKLLSGQEVDALVPKEWLQLPERMQMDSSPLTILDDFRRESCATIFAMLEDENELIRVMLRNKCLPSNPKCSEIAVKMGIWRNKLQDDLNEQLRNVEDDDNMNELSLTISVFRSMLIF